MENPELLSVSDHGNPWNRSESSIVRKQESRLTNPLELGILMGWLGMWDNPELLAVSGSLNSLASFRETTLSCDYRI